MRLHPMAAAVRISVPALPGSFRLSHTREIGSWTCGGHKASPWFGFLKTPAIKFFFNVSHTKQKENKCSQLCLLLLRKTKADFDLEQSFFKFKIQFSIPIEYFCMSQ